MWFQSMDDPGTAFPVMHPNLVKPDYNPTVNDELLAPLGTLTEENTYVLAPLFRIILHLKVFFSLKALWRIVL